MVQFNRDDPQDLYFGIESNFTGISPVGWKILIEVVTPTELQEFESKGLEIPETVKQRYTNATVVGLVVELGKDCYNDKDFPGGPWCKPGDYVVMSPHTGVRIKSPKDGKDYRFINEDNIEGTVPGPEFVTRGGGI